MRPLRCLLSSQFVTAAVLAERPVLGLVGQHEAQCLRCQAHRASVRNTRRALAGLLGANEPPPMVIEQRVLESVTSPERTVVVRGNGDRQWWPAAATAGVAFAFLATWSWRHLRSQSGRI